jgi:hypothetical protein
MTCLPDFYCRKGFIEGFSSVFPSLKDVLPGKFIVQMFSISPEGLARQNGRSKWICQSESIPYFSLKF